MALREAAVRRGLHVSEYGILDDATGETHALRDRGGGLRAARACRGSRPSCARTAASWRCRRRRCPCSSSRATSRATCTATPRSATGAPTPRRWRCARASSGSSTSRSPTTRRPTASATTSRPTRCARQIEEVRELDERLDGIEVLVGTETNIGPTARPTTTTTCSRELDWVVGSVHTSFAIGADAMTERMIAAIEHPLIDAIGHPTGRKIESRAPYAVDVERAHRGRRAHRHDARDQLRARPPRPQRRPRARRGRGGREDPHRLRRPRRRTR